MAVHEQETVDDREPDTPKRKRQKTVQNVEVIEIGDVNISPESKRLLKMQKDVAHMLECRRTERTLREKYNMLV
jgi:hypothetical protein